MLTTAPNPLVPAAAETARDDQPITRQIACMAAFYGDEAQAQATLAGLAQLPGLGPAHWAVLAPADAAPRRFARLSRRWAAPFQANRAPPRSPLWRLSGMGLLLAAAVALLWWLQTEPYDIDPGQAPLIWTGLVVAALAGASLVMLGGGWRQPPRPRRFDRQVQLALAAGRWVVVVQGLPWTVQHGAVTLLRGQCIGWCAEPLSASGTRL